MSKEDVKTVFLTIVLLLVISAMILLGIKMYSQIMQQSNNNVEEAFEGNSIRTANITEENKTNVVTQNGDILNQITSANGNSTQLDEQSEEKYLYKQLESEAQIIYDKLASNKDNLKTGTYRLNFGSTFTDLLSQDNGSDLLQVHYQSAIECFLYDNPDVFYLDPTKMYINIQTTKKVFSTTYDVYIDQGSNANYLADGYTSKSQIVEYENQIKQVADSILSQIENESDYNKLKVIHDYLIDNVVYDESVSQSDIYNIYGALVKKEAVCEGYAKAFKYLAEQTGIECIIVIGTATDSSGVSQSHAWNYVKLGTTWYAVDVTWDDPIIVGGGRLTTNLRYKYFLKGSITMDIDHIKSERFVDNGRTYTYPTLSVSDY